MGFYSNLEEQEEIKSESPAKNNINNYSVKSHLTEATVYTDLSQSFS